MKQVGKRFLALIISLVMVVSTMAQAGHGILENHADLVSSEVSHLLFVIRQDILTVESDGPAYDFARLLQKS